MPVLHVLSAGGLWKWLPLFACLACNATGSGDVEESIRQGMAEQELAWDRGDIPGFMEWYADSACFISAKGRTCGKAAVLANYQRSYPEKGTMGDLTFGIHEVVPAGDTHAWLTGTWELVRATDTVGGGFSLLWKQEQQGWRILRDHTY